MDNNTKKPKMVEIPVHVALNLMAFLKNTNLMGSDVPAFTECMSYLSQANALINRPEINMSVDIRGGDEESIKKTVEKVKGHVFEELKK